MTAELRATPQEAKRLVWTSTLSIITVFYCLNVTPIDWLYVCVSALVGGLSLNYWRYPVTGLRLLMDIGMALVSVTCIFTTAWAVKAWGQLLLFGCGLFFFGISSYAWSRPSCSRKPCSSALQGFCQNLLRFRLRKTGIEFELYLVFQTGFSAWISSNLNRLRRA